ncbi:MAG: IS4 family transposase [Myxococcota bacterium]|jgi:hypothetical protein
MKTQARKEPQNDLSSEMAGLQAEPRLVERAGKLLQGWRQKPGVGFPEIYEASSELEAAYRFFSNPNVCFGTLIQAHSEKTKERCKAFKEVLVLEDTTEFCFGGKSQREGLSRINTNDQGFLGHFGFVVSGDGMRIPLGVVAAELYTRPVEKKALNRHKRRESKGCESHRWGRMMEAVEKELGGIVSAIHIMDREGDIYDVLANGIQKQRRFVIRAGMDRKVESDDPVFDLLFDALDGLPVICRDNVHVSFREENSLPDKRKSHPSRRERVADLSISATRVRLKRPRSSAKQYSASIELNVVHVFEANPPSGEQAIEWILLTNEPCSTPEELRRVIAAYRTRWMIEEFFKAIKTGCAYEKRQLTSYHALKNVLGMTIPIAWEMLLLRTQAHQAQDIPAQGFIDPLRIEILKARSKRYPLTDNPSLRDVCYAIAGLGGHIKYNGPPGWLTLRRGYEKLLFAEEIWKLARESYDQS